MVKKWLVLALLTITTLGAMVPAAFACGGDKHGDKTEAVEE